jgi:hypothetical protein|tara:strand:+ start:251 stop:505 length:255 start_codon:yes stop_codon:yes gene_type:complete
MVLTHHAQKRSQQRCITINEIHLILEFGKSKHKPGGAIEYGVQHKNLQKLMFENKNWKKLKNKRVVMIDEVIVTVYHRTNKERN